MAATGTIISKWYDNSIKPHGMLPVYSDGIQPNYIQDAIYNREYRIKAFSIQQLRNPNRS